MNLKNLLRALRNSTVIKKLSNAVKKLNYATKTLPDHFSKIFSDSQNTPWSYPHNITYNIDQAIDNLLLLLVDGAPQRVYNATVYLLNEFHGEEVVNVFCKWIIHNENDMYCWSGHDKLGTYYRFMNEIGMLGDDNNDL